MANRRARRRAAREGVDQIARLREEANWSGFTNWRRQGRGDARPSDVRWRGLLDVMDGAALLFGITLAVSLAIAVVVLAILAIVHALTG
jgi:hypothetical protein